jgi:hypothetical protein
LGFDDIVTRSVDGSTRIVHDVSTVALLAHLSHNGSAMLCTVMSDAMNEEEEVAKTRHKSKLTAFVKPAAPLPVIVVYIKAAEGSDSM